MYQHVTMEVENDESIWLVSGHMPFENTPPFVVSEGGRFTVKKGYEVSRRDKNCVLLLYTIDGEAELSYRRKSHKLQKNTIALIDCREYHEYRVTQNAGWQYYWLHLNTQGALFYHDTICRHTGPLLPAEAISPALFEEILYNMDLPDREAYCAISRCVGSILDSLLRVASSSKSHIPTHKDSIMTTVQYIKSNYRKQLEVGELAQMAGLSKYYYIKLFREYMHLTPYEYLLQHRINEARKLLASSSSKASEIALRVGFTDECNFSRTFKRLTGLTPIQYRKQA